MTSTFGLPRRLIVLTIVLPLAALVGLLLATPDQLVPLASVGLILFALSIPLWLRWYHPLLIFGWNAGVNIFFLPGRPPLWMLLVAVGLGVALLNLTMDKERAFIKVPALTWPLIYIAAVALITAKVTGGMSLHSMGGGQSMGGRWYFFILLGIAGYFALTSRQIPPKRAVLYVSLFFLSAITSVMGNVAYALGPGFYFLFYLFPTDVVVHQVMADMLVGQEVIERFIGVTFAAIGAFSFVVARYGLRGILDFSRPWRLLALIAIMFASMFGGFRSALVIFMLTLTIQFFLEGLHRTRFFVVLLVGCVIGGALLVPLAHRLPRSVQRSLSFLPLKLDPIARMDAQNSLDWRLEMWRLLVPEVPKYLWVGKGYALDATDMYMSVISEKRGFIRSNEASVISGNYHNGPLSVLIPFGIWGAIGFVWFALAGLWALHRNYRFGDPALKNINTFLLSLFIVRLFMFFFLFGAFNAEFYVFIGLLGLSVSLNGGVRKENDLPEAPAAALATADGSDAVTRRSW